MRCNHLLPLFLILAGCSTAPIPKTPPAAGPPPLPTSRSAVKAAPALVAERAARSAFVVRTVATLTGQTNAPPTLAPWSVLFMDMTTGGEYRVPGYRITFQTGTNGQPYEIATSTDLKTWDTVASGTNRKPTVEIWDFSQRTNAFWRYKSLLPVTDTSGGVLTDANGNPLQ